MQRAGRAAIVANRPHPLPPQPPRMAQRRHSHANITAADRVLLAVQEREMQLRPNNDMDFLPSIGGSAMFQHPENVFSCKICGKQFDAVEDLIVDSHRSLLSRKDKYSCRLCDTTGKNKAKMSAHAIKHLKCNDVHYCAKCVTWVGKMEPTCSGVPLEVGTPSDSEMTSLVHSIKEIPETPTTGPSAPSTSQHAPRILTLVSQVTEKKESVLLQWKKQISTREKQICDICGKMAMTRKTKGLEICSTCRIMEIKKHKKDWRIKYVSVIRQLAPSVFQTSTEGKEAEEPLQFCRQCEKPIEDKRALLNILVKEKWQKRSPIVSTLSWDVMQVFYCLICGFKINCFTKIRKHVLTHFSTYDTLYCCGCQQAINEICLDAIPDAGEASLLTAASTPSPKIPVMLGKASMQGVKIGLCDSTCSVNCGKCKKIFDHILPLMQKIIEFHYELAGSREKEASRGCYYYCRICCTKDRSKVAIERHALRHIKQGEVLCGFCQKATKEKRRIAELVPVMVGRDQSQQKDKAQPKVTGTSYAEMQNLSSFTHLSADEEVSEEDAKIFQAFLLSLQSKDFDGDDELFESITTSEWRFVYTEPEVVFEDEFPHLGKREVDNRPASEKNNLSIGKQSVPIKRGNVNYGKQITRMPTVEV